MIIVLQCIIKYGFFAHFDAQISLSALGFTFLIMATVFIAAGGYIINDIYDVTADKINKPKQRIIGVSIDQKQARLLYYLFTFTGMGLGFVLSAMIRKPLFMLYFLLVSISLYVYSRVLKKVPLIGNILISILVAATILILGAFELVPAMNPENEVQQWAALTVLKDIALFAFLINFLRELVKDIEDIQGDHVARYRTLPIVIGAKRTAQAASVFGLIGIFFITLYTFNYLYNEKWAVAIIFFGIIAPLGYVCAQLWEVTTKKQFSRLSLLLKIIMFLGICAIPLISYTLDHAR